MDVSGFLLSLLLAQSSPSLAALGDYHLVTLEKTWPEAQSYCREKFTDLASIESAEDWARVKEMMVDSGKDGVWLGLYDDARSWRWSMDGSYLYTDGISAFAGWTYFTEDNYGSCQHCAELNSTDEIVNDMYCSRLQNSVCYDEPSGTFIPVTQQMDWPSAQSYCRKKYTDLASVRSQPEKEKLLIVLPELQDWWIGLSREGWKWSDQSNSSLRFWATDQPDGGRHDCAKAELDGWDDIDCSTTLPFVCSVPTKKVLKVVVKTDGSVNLDDPKVKGSLLQQMEIHLRERGIQQELRLRWREPPSGRVFNQTHMRK